MATKKEPAAKGYVVVRDFGEYLTGDLVELDADTAADLIRDGMIRQEQEG